MAATGHGVEPEREVPILAAGNGGSGGEAYDVAEWAAVKAEYNKAGILWCEMLEHFVYAHCSTTP